MWTIKPKEKYYITCDGWTICKYFIQNIVKYALWKDSKNYGYFDNIKEAKIKHREITK